MRITVHNCHTQHSMDQFFPVSLQTIIAQMLCTAGEMKLTHTKNCQKRTKLEVYGKLAKKRLSWACLNVHSYVRTHAHTHTQMDKLKT